MRFEIFGVDNFFMNVSTIDEYTAHTYAQIKIPINSTIHTQQQFATSKLLDFDFITFHVSYLHYLALLLLRAFLFVVHLKTHFSRIVELVLRVQSNVE